MLYVTIPIVILLILLFSSNSGDCNNCSNDDCFLGDWDGDGICDEWE